MTGVDEQVGRIINCLKEKGLFENTIVVFTSDHGDCLGIHEQVSKNNFYEESMRIPMIITWPARLRPRMDNQLLICLSDLYPTLLTMMGFEKYLPKKIETRNLAEAVLTGKGKTDYQLYFRIFANRQDEIERSGLRGIRTDRYTYVLQFRDSKVINTTLFDRQKDTFQLTNVAGQNQSTEDRLKKILKEALNNVNDKLANSL